MHSIGLDHTLLLQLLIAPHYHTFDYSDETFSISMTFLHETSPVATGIALVAITLSTAGFLFYSAPLRSTKDGSKSPPYLASYIPVIGRAVEMGQGIRSFIVKYSQRLNVPIFSATIAGKSSHFLTNPDDILWVFTHPKLDMAPLHIDFMVKACGMTQETAKSMYDNDKLSKLLFAGFPRYLLAKEPLTELVSSAQTILARTVDVMVTDEWTTTSLLDFVRKAVFLASVDASISKDMANMECLDLLVNFDGGVPLSMAGVPDWCMPKFVKARQELVQRLKDMKTESPWLANRREAYKTFEYNEDDIARASLSLFWASNGNSIPSIFWALASTLLDPKAYKAAQDEVDAAKSLDTLDDLDQLKVIPSIFWETLRIYFGGFNPRQVKEDMVWKPSGSKEAWKLSHGSTIMSYMGIIHMDPTVFENPTSFVYDRFMPDAQGKAPLFTSSSGKKLAVSPFGGGAHMCPGRKFIQYEFLALVSITLQMVEMRLVEGETLPSVDQKAEGVGISCPQGDMKIQIRRRRHKAAA